ncbi:MarR family winged helix-turn-helix transcriptional regulator [Chakrabartyella piscis]|uniref:MarR family winged helix-turn-helix transcriptional regulator n=1 Tax=Chakrabartyella piscis TaxID=2918914 RepID=UPI002958B4FF|nr:MarR family transcriptional regulator [Chakrabartyella piscis]
MKQILREIGSVARCIEAITDVEFREYQLSKNQYIYLVRVFEYPGIILEQLSDMLKIERSTASRVINRLVENGFIYKVDKNNTKKKVQLYTTEKSLAALQLLYRSEEYFNTVALQDFTEEELEVFASYVHRVSKNLEKDWSESKRGIPIPIQKERDLLGVKKEECM